MRPRENIRTIDLGSAEANDLMLTGDQNLLDIAYSVRWNIRTPELYLFQLAQPDETIFHSGEPKRGNSSGQINPPDNIS